MNLVLFGPPGAGKGTQGEMLSKKYNIPVVSTGNMIREAVKNQTEMGKAAKAIIDSGKLLDDEIVIGIVKEKLAEDSCKNGFLLDGFPRTIPQAEALENLGVKIDAVLELTVNDDDIIKRMSGRRVCPGCGNSYHIVSKKPLNEGVCDDCKSQLIVRDDDKPETVLERLNVYHSQTEPLSNFYRSRQLLRVVDGNGTLDEVAQRMQAAIKDLL